jgi:hypothetical protein
MQTPRRKKTKPAQNRGKPTGSNVNVQYSHFLFFVGQTTEIDSSSEFLVRVHNIIDNRNDQETIRCVCASGLLANHTLKTAHLT